MITYTLIRRVDRNGDCRSCKNRLPEKHCAVELAVVNGITVGVKIEYGAECDQREGASVWDRKAVLKMEAMATDMGEGNDMKHEIICAEVLEWAREYEGPPFHAVLTDTNRDSTGVVFQSSFWATLTKHLHPGGFVFAFAPPRNQYRLACAMEDSGLIIQPSIFVWGMEAKKF